MDVECFECPWLAVGGCEVGLEDLLGEISHVLGEEHHGQEGACVDKAGHLGLGLFGVGSVSSVEGCVEEGREKGLSIVGGWSEDMCFHLGEDVGPERRRGGLAGHVEGGEEIGSGLDRGDGRGEGRGCDPGDEGIGFGVGQVVDEGQEDLNGNSK